MTRRGRGEGTIYQLPDGRWRAQVSLPSGKRLSKTGKVRSVVQRWLAETTTRAADGTLTVSKKTTLSAFFARYLEDIIRPNRRYATYLTYKRLADIHIVPILGDRALSALTPAQIQRFYTAKLDAGLSRATVGLLHAVLRRALKQAMRWGLLAANPTDRVEPPGGQSPPMQVFTADEARRFVEFAQLDNLYPLWLLAITTGMRQGEMLGLRWQDVDLQRARVQVRGGLHLSENGTSGKSYALGPTKTGRSRHIVLSQEAVAALSRHQPPDAPPTGYVFSGDTGGPLARSTVVAAFKRLVATAGLPPIRFHDLRHTAATLLLSRGVHPKVVQEMLGHTSIVTTLDTYSHVLPTMQEDAARVIGETLFGGR